MNRRLLGAVVFGVTAALTCPAQEAREGQEPVWLLLERGRVHFENRDFGEAVRLLLEARVRAAEHGEIEAEVELALARSWRYEGELDLARRSYERAHELADRLSKSDLGYLILEELADLSRLEQNYSSMQLQYDRIVHSDDSFSHRDKAVTDRIADNYAAGGLEKALDLYRLKESFAVTAHRELSWLHYKNGLYRRAIRHGLHASLIVFTLALEELRAADPDYTFADVRTTLEEGYRRPAVAELFEVTDIGRILYYLAAATYAGGDEPGARPLWSALSRTPQTGRYADLSAAQLADPWIEDPLREPFRGAP